MNIIPIKIWYDEIRVTVQHSSNLSPLIHLTDLMGLLPDT